MWTCSCLMTNAVGRSTCLSTLWSCSGRVAVRFWPQQQWAAGPWQHGGRYVPTACDGLASEAVGLHTLLHAGPKCPCMAAPCVSAGMHLKRKTDPCRGSVRGHLIPQSTMISGFGPNTQGHKVTTVSCGAEHSVVATDAGEVGFANPKQQAMRSTTGIVHCAV